MIVDKDSQSHTLQNTLEKSLATLLVTPSHIYQATLQTHQPFRRTACLHARAVQAQSRLAKIMSTNVTYATSSPPAKA